MAKRGSFRSVSRAEAQAKRTNNMLTRDALSRSAVPRSAAASTSADAPLDGEPVVTRGRHVSRRGVASNRPDRVAPVHEARLNWLRAVRPGKLDPDQYEPFRNEVAELIGATAFASRDVDANLASQAAGFLAWATTQGYVPSLRSALTNENLEDYGRYLEAQGRSGVASVLSKLRILQRGGHLPAGRPRSPVRAPYSNADALKFWTALDRMPQPGRVFEGRVLWTLSFACGLTSEEIQAATADWVATNDRGTVLRIPYTTGEYRLVPVPGGSAADVVADAVTVARAALREGAAGANKKVARASAPRAWLLSPQKAGRQDAIYGLKKILRDLDGAWADFDAGRARACYQAALLESPLPFSMVCQLAGWASGTKSPTDLVAHLPRHSDEELSQAIANMPAQVTSSMVGFSVGRGGLR